MIRKVRKIGTPEAPSKEITHEEMWHRMEAWGWFQQNAPWLEVTVSSGLGVIRSQVRATRLLSEENQLLFEGVHSIVQMPFPAAAAKILEVESPQSRYAHEVWLIWRDQAVWVVGQLKKRPKYHEKLRGYPAGLMEVKDRTFGPGEHITLDDRRFVRCTFNQCEVGYFGGEVAFEDCQFNSPNLAMADEAANTVEVLNAMNAFTSGKFHVQSEQ